MSQSPYRSEAEEDALNDSSSTSRDLQPSSSTSFSFGGEPLAPSDFSSEELEEAFCHAISSSRSDAEEPTAPELSERAEIQCPEGERQLQSTASGAEEEEADDFEDMVDGPLALEPAVTLNLTNEVEDKEQGSSMEPPAESVVVGEDAVDNECSGVEEELFADLEDVGGDVAGCSSASLNECSSSAVSDIDAPGCSGVSRQQPVSSSSKGGDKARCAASSKAGFRLPRDKSDGYVCPICDKAFPDTRALLRHFKGHSKDQPLLWPNYLSLAKQIQEAKKCGEAPFTCDTCGGQFKKERTFRMHLMAGHPANRYRKCKYCRKCFRKVEDLNAHEDTHFR